MEWYWIVFLFVGIFAVVLVTIHITIKLCEFRYYGSPIHWREMLRGRSYRVCGLTTTPAGDVYALVKDRRREEVSLILLPSDLDRKHIRVRDRIKVLHKIRPGKGVFVTLYRALRKKGQRKKLVCCYSMRLQTG